MNKKTLWQKIYSWFGFWQYYEIDQNGDEWLITYWCCFPFKFIRKFDLVRFKTGEKYE